MKRGKPLLVNIFGENNTIKVLDFLIMGKDFDFTITHIGNGTGLSRTAVRNSLLKLTDINIVEKSRSDDKSDYFRINKKNNKFIILNELYERVMADVVVA